MQELLLLLTAIVTGANCFVIAVLKRRVKWLEAVADAQHDTITDLYALSLERK